MLVRKALKQWSSRLPRTTVGVARSASDVSRHSQYKLASESVYHNNDKRIVNPRSFDHVALGGIICGVILLYGKNAYLAPWSFGLAPLCLMFRIPLAMFRDMTVKQVLYDPRKKVLSIYTFGSPVAYIAHLEDVTFEGFTSLDRIQAPAVTVVIKSQSRTLKMLIGERYEASRVKTPNPQFMEALLSNNLAEVQRYHF